MITATEARTIATTLEKNKVGDSLPFIMRKIEEAAHEGVLAVDYFPPNWWGDNQYRLMADKLKEYGYTVHTHTRYMHIEWQK